MSVGGDGGEWVVPPPNIYGDVFLGEVSASTFITGDALASGIGLTAGTAQHSNEPWLKFLTGEGKTLYVAKKPFRYNLSWNHINTANAVYGDRTIEINGESFKVRLLKGAASDPTVSGGGHDLEKTWGSEWNRLMYPLVPNPTNTPTHPISGEGIHYGEWGNYTEAQLNVGSSGGNGRYSWCQETDAGNSGVRIVRGTVGLSYISLVGFSSVSTLYGWRPVLELIDD